ncbi:MAG: T9SS type A sorting domain-containing protein [Bacteroidales bacterium]|nr:T9SS type A sorting domain-containing protein [Bacteroidales bacterium]
MKRTILLSVILALATFAMAQNRAVVTKNLRDLAMKDQIPVLETFNMTQEVNPYVKSGLYPEEAQIGTTWYDDQSNASIQNRLYIHPDGTIGATWTIGYEHTAFPDRGSGYNYFDGSAWGPYPTVRIEDVKTGWPSYAPLGENGEIVAAHSAGDGIYFSSRPDKGTGTWNYTLFPGPVGHEYMIWPRLITSGTNHTRLHMLAVTASTAYNGTPYLGLDGALLYSLSNDGGATWDQENVILPGMGSDYYTQYYGDTYTFAEPRGDIIAFVVGETWYDLYLMKSTDGGQTFEKTIIWEHPYPYWVQYTATDTFYCADGAHSLVIDPSGMVHVAFGINRAHADGTSSYWFPFVDGIVYWNETMPAFSNDHHALDPYGHPNSELIVDYNLVGWTQDVNNNGVLDFVGTATTNIGAYYLGLSSMPQLVLDDLGRLYLFYSSVTETYDNGTQNYRHIWARCSPDAGTTWGDFFDLDEDLVHIFDECVYPTCASYCDNQYIYMLFQADGEPGLATWGDEDPYGENRIIFAKVIKDEITGNAENTENPGKLEALCTPNPFHGEAEIHVILKEHADILVELFTLNGLKVMEHIRPNASPGLNTMTLDGSRLSHGIYFFSVKAGARQMTGKVIVQ